MKLQSRLLTVIVVLISLFTITLVSGCSQELTTYSGTVTIVNNEATKIHVWTSSSTSPTWEGKASNGIEPGSSMIIQVSTGATITDKKEAEVEPVYLVAGRNGQVLYTMDITPTAQVFEMQFSWDGKKFIKK